MKSPALSLFLFCSLALPQLGYAERVEETQTQEAESEPEPECDYRPVLESLSP